MVDLFGKKSQEKMEQLESSLRELQKERDDLKQILAKRDEKIKKLTSANQEANIALKALESRQSPRLPDEQTDKVRSKEAQPDKDKTCATKITPAEAGTLMQRLGGIKSQKDDLLTAYLTSPGSAAEKSLPPDIQCLASSIKPGRGMAAFQCPGLFSLAILPPLPIREDAAEFDEAFHTQPILDMMETPVLVISAHAGETFIGVALSKEGFELQEMIESQVKEKHSKGGWSQKRFERLREEDIRGHCRAVDEKLQEILARYMPVLKYVVVGGDQSLLKQITLDQSLPKVQRSLEKPDGKHTRSLLDDVYGFTLYRS